ncbi:hypothetical protein Q9L58_010396 [Maublancomyces gigas]|uniref:Uncharacterized protein n=1 Tax=Discina gigas TaxID=1032678 RepID=A0ABR3G478_9PEZI
MRNYTLINWLLIYDLAEFGLCEFPDIDSLITKIQEGSGTGPEMGLNIAFAHLENARAPPTDTDELKAFLNMLEKALDQTIGDEWEQLAGWRLNTNDTEHLLCKVKRIAKHLV